MELNATEITFVDRDRGLQLSFSRVTVQDLVLNVQQCCSPEFTGRHDSTMEHERLSARLHDYRHD